ncbi:hypothetical protein A2U01_0102100, partial [Trifolium medium]|nr:hypothetical protein [Trifolium medium]
AVLRNAQGSAAQRAGMLIQG